MVLYKINEKIKKKRLTCVDMRGIIDNVPHERYEFRKENDRIS